MGDAAHQQATRRAQAAADHCDPVCLLHLCMGNGCFRGIQTTDAGVAYMAHVGGFIAGFLLAILFRGGLGHLQHQGGNLRARRRQRT
jgi:hypothetical protein